MSGSTSATEAFAQAMTCLHSGVDDALQIGVTLLEHAAEQGDGRACAKLAHFMALGVLQRPDWDGSIALLAKAASLGWRPAAEELAILAGREGADVSQIDIRAFIAPRPTQVVRTSPRIRTALGFMNARECAWMIEASRPRLAPAKVYDNASEGAAHVPDRSNSTAEFALLETDLVLVLLRARIANTIGLRSECFEPTSVLHYAPGQEFVRHVDYLDPALPGLAVDLAQRGQRVATFLVSLNDAYEGGETDFPRLDFRYKGQVGDAIVFANVGPDLSLDPRTLHAGLPPTSGEKWLLSQWIRSKPVG